MKEYKLIGRDGKPYMSSEPGTSNTQKNSPEKPVLI